MKRLLRFSLLAWLVTVSVGVYLFQIKERRDSVASAVPREAAWGKFPIDFIENEGQMGASAGYYVKGSDKSLYFTPDGVTVSIHQAPKREKTDPLPIKEASASINWNVKLLFEGTNEGVVPEGVEKTKTKISYFKGPKKDWKADIKTYRKIAYRDLWPGVDLIYSGSMDLLKQDFVVRPGGDPGRIKLAYLGAELVTITDDGGMEIGTPLGGFRDERPVAYQVVDGEKIAVNVSYDLVKRGERYEYGFRLGSYDRERELIIDPATLIYAGFIGGTGSDYVKGVAVDSDGNAYVTGATSSTAATFPETVGPDLIMNGGVDVFVAKVAADGLSLTYAGFIGGSGTEIGYGIAVGGDGSAYVTGYTTSTEGSATPFPVSGGPDLTHNGGTDDVFVAKVAADGLSLTYAGFIGGGGVDRSTGLSGIAVDSAGNAYVTGYTASTQTTFPDGDDDADDAFEVGGFDQTHAGGTNDAFVTKVAANGLSLTYATYIGGSGSDIGYSIKVDGSGYAYVAGSAGASTQSTFPETVGPDLTASSNPNGFVAKVAINGLSLVYAGFIGGTGTDVCYGVAVDNVGSAYVTGATTSSQTSFPDGDDDADDAFEVGGFDQTYNGTTENDAFVVKVKADGTGLDYAGFIGGDAADIGRDIAVDGDGNAYVSGYTDSTQTTFPDGDDDADDAFEVGGFDQTQNGGTDTFVVKVAADGLSLAYAGFIGGTGIDYSNGIAVDGDGNAYLGGDTTSSQTTFPDGDDDADDAFEVVGFDQTSGGGADDGFVMKIEIVVTCGDGVAEEAEECDDGNTTTETCAYGQTSCTVCNASCQSAAGATSYCDDSITDAANGETCDDGVNNGQPNYCNDTCNGTVPATCGNGVVESGETCDDGNTATETCAYGQTSCLVCNGSCQSAVGVMSYCGDSVTDATNGETCDDGNVSDTDACLNSCVSAICGDGIIQSGVEECDGGDNCGDDCEEEPLVPSEGDGLEPANPEVDFDHFGIGSTVTLTAPDPEGSGPIIQWPKSGDFPETVCSCEWSVQPEDLGIFSDARNCEPDFTAQQAGVGEITVTVDCGAAGSNSFVQVLTVAEETMESGEEGDTEEPLYLQGGGCSRLL